MRIHVGDTYKCLTVAGEHVRTVVVRRLFRDEKGRPKAILDLTWSRPGFDKRGFRRNVLTSSIKLNRLWVLLDRGDGGEAAPTAKASAPAPPANVAPIDESAALRDALLAVKHLAGRRKLALFCCYTTVTQQVEALDTLLGPTDFAELRAVADALRTLAPMLVRYLSDGPIDAASDAARKPAKG